MACCFPWCTADAVRRRLVYEIRDYRRLLARLGANESVSSTAFSIGGYDWAVSFYPYGSRNAEPGHVSAFVGLVTPGASARASFRLTFLPWSSGGARGPSFKACPLKFCHGDSNGWGIDSFVKRTKLESPAYLRDDTVRLECDITVFVKRRPASELCNTQ